MERMLNDFPVPPAIQVHHPSELTDALLTLGLTEARPTFVLVGGASGLQTEYLDQLQQLFTERLAPLAQQVGAYVVDGGTDSGVMRLMGRARQAIGGSFSLVGVAAIGTVVLPSIKNTFGDAAPLEPHHSHFVLVPGNQWGDESPWIAQVATHLAQGKPSVTVLINGGKITLQDAKNSILAARPVVVVAGSGRTADRLVKALQGQLSDDSVSEEEQQANQEARFLANSGHLEALDLADGFSPLARAIARMLSI